MGARTASSSRTAPSAGTVSIDVVLVSCHERRLSVLAEATGAAKRRGFSLPWGTPAKGEHLDAAAARMFGVLRRGTAEGRTHGALVVDGYACADAAS